MVKWDLKTHQVWILGNYEPEPIKMLTKKNEETGMTHWEILKELANEGWELVSVTPLALRDGRTASLLYTFKRPKDPQ